MGDRHCICAEFGGILVLSLTVLSWVSICGCLVLVCAQLDLENRHAFSPALHASLSFHFAVLPFSGIEASRGHRQGIALCGNALRTVEPTVLFVHEMSTFAWSSSDRTLACTRRQTRPELENMFRGLLRNCWYAVFLPRPPRPHVSRCHSTAALIPSCTSAFTRSGLMMSCRNRSVCSSCRLFSVGPG